jgi:hypothetical protein
MTLRAGLHLETFMALAVFPETDRARVFPRWGQRPAFQVGMPARGGSTELRAGTKGSPSVVFQGRMWYLP